MLFAAALQALQTLAPFQHSQCLRLSDCLHVYRMALLDNAYIEAIELYKGLLGATTPW